MTPRQTAYPGSRLGTVGFLTHQIFLTVKYVGTHLIEEETLSKGVEHTKKSLLTVTDLAGELGINERTATAIVRRGQITITTASLVRNPDCMPFNMAAFTCPIHDHLS
jgi:hypothetical protein